MRFLVTGASGDVGLSAGRVLKDAYPGAMVDGADASGPWPGGFVFDHMHSLPYADAPEYSEAFTKLGANYDLVIPTTEPELERLASDQPPISMRLLKISDNLIPIFLDKLATAQWLGDHGLGAPGYWSLNESRSDNLPLILKPRRGAGGRGHRVVRTPSELEIAKMQMPITTMAQELLEVEDQEYTCALFGWEEEYRCIVLRRWLQGGHTYKAVVADKPIITELLLDIALSAQLKGSINVQLRLCDDGPKVFEVNPRLSSTVMMRHRLGFQDLVWWIKVTLGESLPANGRPKTGQTIYRMSHENVVPE